MKRIGKEQRSASPDTLLSSLLPTSRCQRSCTHKLKSSLLTTQQLKSPTPPPMFWRKAPVGGCQVHLQSSCDRLHYETRIRQLGDRSFFVRRRHVLAAQRAVNRAPLPCWHGCWLYGLFSDAPWANGKALKESSHVHNRLWPERVVTISDKVGWESERRMIWRRLPMFIRVVHCLNCCSKSYLCRNSASRFVRILVCRVLQSVAGKQMMSRWEGERRR